MKTLHFRFGNGMLALLLVVGLSACSLPDAHVLDSDRFNRDAADYGKDPKDISTVAICYNAMTATPAKIVALAEERCGRFRKTAVFVRQAISDCPLFNPVAAIYNCVDSRTPR